MAKTVGILSVFVLMTIFLTCSRSYADSNVKGRVLTASEMIERFKGKYPYEIFRDPDFKQTLKANLKISDGNLKKLITVMDMADKSVIKDGNLLLTGDMSHWVGAYWGGIRISPNGKISCLALLYNSIDTLGNSGTFVFYTNDPGFSSSIDVSLAGDDHELPDTFPVMHYFDGNEKIVNISKNIGAGNRQNMQGQEQLDPCGDLYQMFKLGSNYTDLQREAALKILVGRKVHWRLKLYEVKSTSKGFKIITHTSSCMDAYVYIDSPQPNDRNYLMSKKTGDWIEFEGVIDDTSLFRDFVIKDARLIY